MLIIKLREEKIEWKITVGCKSYIILCALSPKQQKLRQYSYISHFIVSFSQVFEATKNIQT
jgi:hypothetical protein